MDHNKDQLPDKYQCPKCHHMLREAVQTSCGHWLCAGCAEDLFEQKDSTTPICPRPDCNEELIAEGGHLFFPDRFVRKEILRYVVVCPNEKSGCRWKGAIAHHDSHLKECAYRTIKCPYCKETFSQIEYSTHSSTCSKAPVYCPLKDFGCDVKEKMTKDECVEHLTTKDGLYQHAMLLASYISMVQFPSNIADSQNDSDRPSHLLDINTTRTPETQPSSSIATFIPSFDLLNYAFSMLARSRCTNNRSSCRGPFANSVRSPEVEQLQLRHLIQHREIRDLRQSITNVLAKCDELRRQLAEKDSLIRMLQDKVKQLEVNQQSKSTENEDRDFRLSLMENSNFDGTMVWKIPQFSQRMDDARTGKYTSIFSLPFYSSRYGYKMCLRLYILGDGIGKGSHMSLFFVVMKGEFDNILQWPFTHKVTFKLINQCGRHDIIDTFQPDPLSSSFQKPKSDMNIASGCPRFVSLTELMQGGYIVDDTVFIKVTVDTSTIHDTQP